MLDHRSCEVGQCLPRADRHVQCRRITDRAVLVSETTPHPRAAHRLPVTALLDCRDEDCRDEDCRDVDCRDAAADRQRG
jgi:hypothetical protein